jgi:hypothetical protein
MRERSCCRKYRLYQSFMAVAENVALFCAFRKGSCYVGVHNKRRTCCALERTGRSDIREPTIGELGEIALTVTFTLTAVLFASFLAVVTGLV